MARTLTKALVDVGYLNDQVNDPKLQKHSNLICLNTNELPKPPNKYVVVFIQEKSIEEIKKEYEEKKKRWEELKKKYHIRL